jgi:hypothetical protein
MKEMNSKEMNGPETQLRSWQPRRPSAKLKQRIFTDPHTAPTMPVWSLRWLTPAAAGLLLAVAALDHDNNVSSGHSVHGPMIAILASNQIAYLPGDYQQGQNRLPDFTFEWTNRGGSTSSIHSFRPAR